MSMSKKMMFVVGHGGERREEDFGSFLELYKSRNVKEIISTTSDNISHYQWQVKNNTIEFHSRFYVLLIAIS